MVANIFPVLTRLNKQMIFAPAWWKLLTSLYWPLWFEALPLSQRGIKNSRPAALSNALLMTAVETRHKINKVYEMVFFLEGCGVGWGGAWVSDYACIRITGLSLKFEILPFISCSYREQAIVTSGRDVPLERTFFPKKSCISRGLFIYTNL